jgi:glycosyltransferase involved in cell wall biosynthesis
VPLLCSAIAAKGHRVELVHTNSPSPVSLSETDFFKIKTFNQDLWLKPLKGSKALRGYVYAATPDLYHGHALWQFPVHYMARAAQKKKIPYVISPRGMLEPGALKFSSFKKRVAGVSFQNKNLMLAECLHATGELEAKNLRRYGLKNPIAVIPNGLAVNKFNEFLEKGKFTGNHTILFLSRIHPKKGVMSLIEAWAELESIYKEWILVIAGNDENQYEKKLKLQARKMNIAHRIRFVGPVYGDKKKELFRNSDLFVLPSLSENFGIVIAEALASGTPVITTQETPWEDLVRYKCGWWIQADKNALVNALKNALSLESEERLDMGRRGNQLVMSQYSISSVSDKMILLYEWIVNKSRKPDFVYC